MLELDLRARRGSFNLEIKCLLSSDWTVVFGPSGAGKSMLLRLLAGLDENSRSEPVRGKVTLDGRILTDTARAVWCSPGHRRTSLVAQQPALSSPQHRSQCRLRSRRS